MRQLCSPWGKTVEARSVLSEYPRPQLVRDSYFSLNGEWEYAIRKTGQAETYDGTILVPFSPESRLSGVDRILQPDEYLHYRKCFILPDGFKKDKVYLHFGAVDQECSVFLNGTMLGEHKGGYLAFSFEISGFLVEGENTLTVSVRDYTEHAPHARGKQRLNPTGKYASLFYTPSSGIWKPVWMESTAACHVSEIKFTPYFDEQSIGVFADVCGESDSALVRISQNGEVIGSWTIKTGTENKLLLEKFRPWSPEKPDLYDVEVSYIEDKVTSYFGMRKLSVSQDRKGVMRFFLNNKPFFFNGLLDQGYWPESLMTAPDDKALLYDIRKLKSLGYNTIRKHVKIETDRFYYHCDRLGMMVWQDMPNGGGTYNMFFVTELPNTFDWFCRRVKDNRYRPFARTDAAGRKQYYEDLEDMVKQLYNHPSIAVWVPFNEGWGQFDARKATERIRRLDRTRLVNEACGWFDQGGGDMYSIHNYRRILKMKPVKDRVVALTEYGGYSLPVKGHMECDRAFGYQTYKTVEELTDNYKRLWEQEIFPNLERGLCSAVYTQVSDIEEEINGVMTYDRRVDKLDGEIVRNLNEKLYRMFRNMV